MRRKVHTTMRGRVIDMESIIMQNDKTIAIGNASKNARGDQVGQGGKVLKTQEQIEAEWAALREKQEKSIKAVSLKDEFENQPVPAPQVRPAALRPDHAVVTPKISTENIEFKTLDQVIEEAKNKDPKETKPKRKIVDKD